MRQELFRFLRIAGDHHVIFIHLDQRSDEGKALKATIHAETDRITDLEGLFIEVEFEGTCFPFVAHTLHFSSPLRPSLSQ